MHFDWSTFALQTVNFAILVWLLQRFLYRPLLRLVDARRNEIEERFAAAYATTIKAQEQLAAVEAERGGIAAERAAKLNQAASQAEDAAAARRAQAEREAAAVLDAARSALAAERSEALAEAKSSALDLGAEIAVKLLAELPMRQCGEAWLERLEGYLALLPPVDRDALVAQLHQGAELKVVTATPLSDETAEVWRVRLRRIFGERVRVAFDADAQLLGGADLYFPDTVLRFSWQSSLIALQAEMAGHGNAR